MPFYHDSHKPHLIHVIRYVSKHKDKLSNPIHRNAQVPPIRLFTVRRPRFEIYASNNAKSNRAQMKLTPNRYLEADLGQGYQQQNF